jgi:hypothetical protein
VDQRLPRRREQVLVADFGTELVVLVADRRQTHRLDEGLSLVLSSCDGETLVDDLVSEVSEGTGEVTEVTAAWLVDCLNQLVGLGIVEPGDACGPDV